MSTVTVTIGFDEQGNDPPVTATLRRDGTQVAEATFDAEAWASFVQGIRHAFGDDAADGCVQALRDLADRLQTRQQAAAAQKTQLEQSVAAITAVLPE